MNCGGFCPGLSFVGVKQLSGSSGLQFFDPGGRFAGSFDDVSLGEVGDDGSDEESASFDAAPVVETAAGRDELVETADRRAPDGIDCVPDGDAALEGEGG